MTVLIIDDDPDFADFLEIVLLRRHLDVTVASDGRQGIEFLRHNQPDIVFLDLNMPEVDGIEVLKYLSSVNHLAGVVVTSGYIDEYQQKHPKLFENVGILYKPFEMEQLDEILRQLGDHK